MGLLQHLSWRRTHSTARTAHESMLCHLQVSLNTVDNVETFLLDINNGRWDTVLPQVMLMLSFGR